MTLVYTKSWRSGYGSYTGEWGCSGSDCLSNRTPDTTARECQAISPRSCLRGDVGIHSPFIPAAVTNPSPRRESPTLHRSVALAYGVISPTPPDAGSPWASATIAPAAGTIVCHSVVFPGESRYYQIQDPHA